MGRPLVVDRGVIRAGLRVKGRGHERRVFQSLLRWRSWSVGTPREQGRCKCFERNNTIVQPRKHNHAAPKHTNASQRRRERLVRTQTQNRTPSSAACDWHKSCCRKKTLLLAATTQEARSIPQRTGPPKSPYSYKMQL